MCVEDEGCVVGSFDGQDDEFLFARSEDRLRAYFGGEVDPGGEQVGVVPFLWFSGDDGWSETDEKGTYMRTA